MALGRRGAPAKAWQALDQLHDKGLNFDLERRGERTPANGWNVDDYRQSLPPEPPGEPVAAGTWEVARELMRNYEFADPALVRAVFHADRPLEDRNMLLEGRFLGLRFWFGVRVGGVNDRHIDVEQRRVRVWGWNYRTLQGHLEMGQMDFEVWKWLSSGAVEFRIHAVSKPAAVRNPFVGIGFRLFGRRLQRRFAHAACARMAALVEAGRRGEPVAGPGALEGIAVRPASGDRSARRRLKRSQG